MAPISTSTKHVHLNHAPRRPILCMEHCPNHQIFGFDIPHTCPKCESELALAEFHIPPFCVPNPFSNAADCSCTVVLKPTTGTFQRDYKPGDNLHIGITSSLGAVYEYDQDGLRSDKNNEWTECIAIKDIFSSNGHAPFESLIRNHWDHVLLQTGSPNLEQNSKWSKERYNEWTNNCYIFVMHFLQTLYHRLYSVSLPVDIHVRFDDISTTERFCEKFILEKTKSAGKYIALYRQLAGKE